jgi:hypothetical protein
LIVKNFSLDLGTPIIVLEAFNIILTEVISPLNFNESEVFFRLWVLPR